MPERYRVVVAGRRLTIGRHTVERYQERVKPALSVEQARVELGRVLPLCESSRIQPTWTAVRRDADGWLLLGDGVAFPLQGDVIVSCLTRSEIGSELRAANREERQERVARDRQPGTRKKHGKVARDARYRRRQLRAGGRDGGA